MNPNFLQEKIDNFWKWFIEHEEKFRIITDPRNVREMLDNQILQFGPFYWEIGEGTEKPHTFIISPNGDKKLLDISLDIMDEAPDLPHWEFYGAKPSRDWDYTFEMYDNFVVKQKIDASEWEYIMRMSPERKIKLLIYAENIDFLDEEDKMVAANLVVNNIIGEEYKIIYIESISFIPFVNEHQENDIQMMPQFGFEFDKILDEME